MEQGGNACSRVNTTVRVQLLGLLSARLIEYSKKEKFGSSGSVTGHTLKKGQFASPGMLSVPCPRMLLIPAAEQSTPATKADIPQGLRSILKYSKVVAESNMKPRARKPLVAGKKSKVVSKPSRDRVQFVLTHMKEETGDLSFISCDSDDKIDDPLLTTHKPPTEKKPNKGQEQVQEQVLGGSVTPQGPFTLTHDNGCKDPFGGQHETKGATAGEPDRGNGVITANHTPITTDPANIFDSETLKPSLHKVNAPPKGLMVSFKDLLGKFGFYHYPDHNDNWSRCGLPMRITRESCCILPTNPRRLTYKLKSNSSNQPLDKTRALLVILFQQEKQSLLCGHSSIRSNLP